ncbi:MAG: 2-polyprenyl-3-methyl-6-methoxy-1,4-benzoquinone monooxygenase [Gammaproteobacteria bacterium]|nr:2-polyprenyl-3-methyl-6-methoxy-1,4-benzoquinone monooxygenase [Gammaproteobacteria bacterium]
MNRRHYSPIDHILINVDQAVRTVCGKPITTERDNPAYDCPENSLSDAEKRRAAALMRINHAGEVSAQALYQGQALTAKLPEVREKMERAALEENDHLEWCENRLNELESRTSVLNPLWYAGSLAIGALAGRAGDKWSLGFVAETEHQVIRHLDKHLQQLPERDEKSRAILEQMREDEARHATVALQAGGAELPAPVKVMMKITSKVMTRSARWL